MALEQNGQSKGFAFIEFDEEASDFYLKMGVVLTSTTERRTSRYGRQ